MPRRLGNIRLRYDAELLIGERVPPLDAGALVPDVLVLTGLAAGVVAVATLIAPDLRKDHVWGTLVAAIIATAATMAGLILGGLRRGRRGFVVNFDQHTVRVDEPGGLRIRSATTLVPFRDVQAVQVVERYPGSWALALALKEREVLLLDSAREGELDQLDRLCRMLEASFAQDPGPQDPGPQDLSPPGA